MVASETVWSAPDGVQLFTRHWTPEQTPKASVLLVHGLCEHSGRYQALVSHLCGAGYCVRALDLRGHGRSEGRRGDARFALIFADLDALLEEDRGRGPVFLYGHSLGGLIVLAYAIDRRPAVAGVVASAAALHTVVREQRVKVMLARLLPELSVTSGLEPSKLSRDPAVVEDYLRDPLVHRRMTAGFGRDSLAAIDRVLAHRGPLSAPSLLIHGDADQINRLSGSQAVAAHVGDTCTLHIYPGVFHQPHTDPDSPRVFVDLTAWLDSNVNAGT